MNSKMTEVQQEIEKVIVGKEEIIEKVLVAILAGGHILLEDVPGVGKTTLALAVSKVMGLDFKRVQFTPDVVPSDITGFTMYDKQKNKFVYHTPFLYQILVIVIVSILLIFLLCRIGYKLIRKIGETWKRQRLFQKEACKVAVSAIYSYMESCGYPIKEEAKILGNKAAYSLMEITEEERQWMLREWKRAKRENRENEKKKRNCCKHSIGAPIYRWMQRGHIK